jgi:hypothetical protein
VAARTAEAAVNAVNLLVGQEVDPVRGLNEIAGAYPCPQTPGQFLIAVDAVALDEVHIEGVARFSEFNIRAVCAVEVGLDLNVRTFARVVLPAGQ